MSKDPNQKQENSYEGILGDYQEQKETVSQNTDSVTEPKKSGKALKIAGIAIASVAVIGLGIFGVQKLSKPDTVPDAPGSENQSASSDQVSNPESTNSPDLPDNPDAAMYSANLEISPALMECFYRDYLSQMETAFSYYGIDPDVSLKEQMLPEEAGENMSWFDYMINQLKSSVSQLLVFNEAANADGYVMTDEDNAKLEDAISNVDMSVYGDNVTEEDVHTMFEMQIRAAGYFDTVVENMAFTDEDLDAYYQEHKTDFDTCGLAGFSVHYDIPEETDAETEEQGMTKEQAEAYADKLENAKSSQEFEEIVCEILLTYEGYTEEMLTESLPTLYANNFTYQSGFDVSEWAFSEDTKLNDTYRTDSDGSISVYMLTREASLDDTATVNARHILFSADDHMEELDEDADEATQEAAQKKAMQTCHQLAENLLAEWESGEKTEESFAELANAHSEDPGSNTNGGLYQNIYVGQMVTSFNDWCFDSSRQPGDTGIVETSYGVHIMYFSGNADPLWKNTARNALQSEGMNTWYAEQQAIWAVNSNADVINTIED
ncbi:MAG: peptidyl-prolyl cis-trans isomerase [Oscillospiraceae bacterium]|nr:peptidyl-prolyl cis-trans isomerase [Oscillospiraceae bacterium]